uniref:DDE domain-containing protein n=1 Tax=Escherichia coli TaxID=562 RepID=A0A0X8ATA8_ECOLX|nr:hypothetical protein [Escherichia coli]
MKPTSRCGASDLPVRAVDKRGDTIDFYLSPTRSAKAAKRFLGKALRGLKHWEKPATLNTDKAPSYGAAITELKREGKLDRETAHRQVKYLNNVIEADHGKAQDTDQAGARFQIDPHGLCHDQGIRSHASPAQRTGSPLVPAARHQGRGAPCGESFWHWALGADGGHGHAQPPFRQQPPDRRRATAYL